jgi:peptidoglycan/xylan/chitin deacetylase (PgdA/CDA1 family)
MLGSLLAGVIVIAIVTATHGRSPSHAVAARPLPRQKNPKIGIGRTKPGAHPRPHSSRAAGAREPTAGPVPILMYHVIAPPLVHAPYPGLYVPPAEFAAQMRALALAGYHGVTLDRVRSAWRGGATLPRKPIVISFDNGYRTQYTEALPVLRRLGWVADENLQLSGLPPSQGGLSETQVRRLIAAGWELDTQGYSHADLIRLDPTQLHYQVAAARTLIQRRYHVRADWFCYPSGHYNATVIAAVKAAGYVGSTTVVPGWARPDNNPYRLPRLRVLGGTSPQALLNLIIGSRDAPAPPAAYPSYG